MILQVKDLHKSFDQKEVLHGISFEASSGKALGLLGRNGAGKTTTIRILMDIFKCDKGSITLDGKPFIPRQHHIGYLPEERGLYPKKSVIEQLVYLGVLRGLNKKSAKESSKKWLKRMGIEEYENRKLETLSKGNQQKVQLVQTLICEPDIVVLDEPFSGLDPVNSQVLKEVVMELIDSGKVVIFSSHQMNYVEEFCEDIIIINHGDVVLQGNLKEIKKEYGSNRLVLSAANMDHKEFSHFITNEFFDCLSIYTITKDFIVVDAVNGKTQKEILTRLMDKNIELEKFGIYEPTLNDIFVERAGDNK